MRILTLNLWQEQGPWPRRMELCASRLAALSPDVICLQEVREVPDRVPNQAETLASRLGYTTCVYRAVQPWGGGDEGLAILSRWPLEAADDIELPFWPDRSRRRCLGARLKAPSGPFWVFTTHLAYRLGDGALRELQVLEAERFVSTRAASLPGTASLLCGDFNAVPESDEMRFLRGLCTLGGRRVYYQDAFEKLHPGVAGHTWCRENPYTAALAFLEPDRRLDYIYVTPRTRAGAGVIESCRIVLSEPDPDGVYCSDHYGLLCEVRVHADEGVGAASRPA